MNSKFIIIITLAVVLFGGIVFGISSTSTAPPPARAVAQHHLTVLLDLSNRIDPKLGRGPQAARDLQDIQTVLDVFKQQVKQNLYINSRDQLSVVVSRQRGSNPSAEAEHQADFTIDMGALPINNKQKKRVEALSDSLYQQTKKLYSEAQGNSSFTGADIWSFFDQELPAFLMPNKTAAHDSIINTLVIVTDGYNDFSDDILKKRPRSGNRTSYGQVVRLSRKPDPLATFDKEDYGLMATQKYPDLRVLVLELAAHNNDATQGLLLRKYWTKWFDEMGIPNEHRQLMLNNASPSLTAKSLQQLMQASAQAPKAIAIRN
jgi:hypothetical protein